MKTLPRKQQQILENFTPADVVRWLKMFTDRKVAALVTKDAGKPAEWRISVGDGPVRHFKNDHTIHEVVAAMAKELNRGPKDGTVKSGAQINADGGSEGLLNGMSNESFYVRFGVWKGPFDTAKAAKDAYREWAFETKHG